MADFARSARDEPLPKYMSIDFEALISAASAAAGTWKTPGCVTACEVGAAILAASGETFVGVSVEASCGIGFCAEHAAVAEMLKRRESHIIACVAVGPKGDPIPPCGRCRELMHQLSPENRSARILVARGKILTLQELLPHPWEYR